MIDTHAHLDALDDPGAALARAREAGVTRVIAIGTGLESSRRVLDLAESEAGVFCALGIHPHDAGSSGYKDVAALAELLAHPKALAVGETGLDHFREYAPHDRQAALFRQQAALAAETGKALVVHTRAADDDTVAVLAGLPAGLRIVLHCFSSSALLEPALERRWYCSFAGNVTYPKAESSAGPPPACPPTGSWPRRTRPTCPPSLFAGSRTSRRTSSTRCRHSPRPATRIPVSSRRRSRRTRPGRSACRERSDGTRLRPVIRPKRELGQHFLADRNILGVAGRLAVLSPDDVVLEVGAGLGVLTTYLADRVALVHAVELDRSLEPGLREALGDRANVELIFGDVLTLSLASLDPPPTKIVANLPYRVATPVVAESLDGLPTVELWTVMVQREVADRLFAEPGTRAYGAVSVLVQLTCERTGVHPVARTVFHPPPNVDSALVAFRRTRAWGDEYSALKRLVQAAFAHRRKTLANSLELSSVATRAEASAALARIGREPGVRAEVLAPEEFVALVEAL